MPLEVHSKSSEIGFGPHIPTYFTSLQEAQNSFCYHQNRCLKKTYDLDTAVLRRNPASLLVEDAYLDSYIHCRDAIREILHCWSSAFEAFLVKSSATMDSKALQGAAVLKINHRVASLNIKFNKQSKLQDPTNWDPYTRECAEIVDLVTLVLNMNKNGPESSRSRSPLFSMDMNTVFPLFNIAHRCRDPTIRRRAIALLYSPPRQEGLWHSVITARVAERMMTMEEAGLGEVKSCNDVPEENRLAGIDVQFDLQGRKGYLKYSRRQRTGQHMYVNEPLLEVLEEVIEW